MVSVIVLTKLLGAILEGRRSPRRPERRHYNSPVCAKAIELTVKTTEEYLCSSTAGKIFARVALNGSTSEATCSVIHNHIVAFAPVAA